MHHQKNVIVFLNCTVLMNFNIVAVLPKPWKSKFIVLRKWKNIVLFTFLKTHNNDLNITKYGYTKFQKDSSDNILKVCKISLNYIKVTL